MLSLIAAMSENRVIGVDGDLPWRLPDDMKHFMCTTRGHAVIMGRKTWESMDGPLSNRTNIVITRQEKYEADGATVVHSLPEALRIAPTTIDESFVIGGEAIFRDALPLADRIYLTLVHAEFQGDAFFPEFAQEHWRIVDEQHHSADERHEHSFTIRTFERKP